MPSSTREPRPSDEDMPVERRFSDAIALLFKPTEEISLAPPPAEERERPKSRLSMMLEDSAISPGHAVDELSMQAEHSRTPPVYATDGLLPRALFSDDLGRHASVSLDESLADLEAPSSKPATNGASPVKVAEQQVREALVDTTLEFSPPRLERLRSALAVADSEGATCEHMRTHATNKTRARRVARTRSLPPRHPPRPRVRPATSSAQPRRPSRPRAPCWPRARPSRLASTSCA
jgi:hypothetical protein